MRRWGQIAERKSDEWFIQTAEDVHRLDINVAARGGWWKRPEQRQGRSVNPLGR